MKRLLIALGIGASVFGGIFGLAAGLDVNSDTLGAGSAVVAACQPDTSDVSVSYTPTFASGSYKSTTVAIGGLDAGCQNKSMKVTLTGSAGSLGEWTGSTDADDSTNVSFPTVAAEAVTGVHVTIYG